MPEYTFECEKCGGVEEEFCAVRDLDGLTAGKRCACGAPMRRVFLPPNIQTDSTFFRGVGMLGDQIDTPKDLDMRVNAARRHGYSPGQNDMYIPTLAQFPGDPRAFVSQADGRGEIKRRCIRNQTSCEGLVNYQAGQRPPRPKVKLAEQTIRRYMKQAIKKDPGAANTPEKKRALRERIIQAHAFNK